MELIAIIGAALVVWGAFWLDSKLPKPPQKASRQRSGSVLRSTVRGVKMCSKASTKFQRKHGGTWIP